MLDSAIECRKNRIKQLEGKLKSAQNWLRNNTATELVKKACPSVPYSENRHVNVKRNKSPYDGDLVYWSQRNSKLCKEPD
jgi:RNA-directed DNA polymerase